MKSLPEWLDYQKLELSPLSQSTSSAQNSLLSRLAQIWRSIIRYGTAAPELRVWQSRALLNRTVWYAYDPMTGDSISVGSEAEMRLWIEQRYSH
jgi:hypothetical protein